MKNTFPALMARVPRRNRRGFILIATYFVITMVTVFSLAYFGRSDMFKQANERNRNKTIAFNMAEAGLDFALAQLAADSAWTGVGYTSLDTDSVSGGFSVNVTTPAGNTVMRMIEVSGASPSADMTERGAQGSAITAYAQFDTGSLFEYAVFAEDGISLTGNAVVDSYDSRDGAYGGANKANNGDVATNAVTASKVTLNGNATIKGDAFVGTTGNPAQVISTTGNASITGGRDNMDENITYATPTTSLAAGPALSIAGNTNYPLLEGTYRFSSLKITGNAQINCTGAVTIYVDGSVDIAGNGFATQNNTPTNLIIKVMGTDDVKISGNGTFYGGIFAPDAAIKNSGNGAIYGALVTKEYTQTGNGAVHFDEAMKELEGDTANSKPTVVAWQEQNSLTWGTGS